MSEPKKLQVYGKFGGGLKTVNGLGPDENGNVNIVIPEIPEGFSGSWNDLTDKPDIPTAVDTAVTEALTKAKESGEFDGASGADGKDGTNGKDGTSVTISSVTESTASGGTNVVTFSDGNKVNIKNGTNGTNGKDGADGYTPVKGKDYFDGKDGANGKDGADGKSAYAYAREGGYTGTEAEFAEKMAKELPTKVSELDNDSNYVPKNELPKSLKNPYALNINGTPYDGSQSVSVLTPRMFFISITQDDDGNFSSNADFLTLKGMIENGFSIYCMLYGFFLPMLVLQDESIAFAITIAAEESFFSYSVSIYNDNSVTVDAVEASALPNPNALTINGTSYDGSEAKDITDTINAMIDAKLAAIPVWTGGAY